MACGFTFISYSARRSRIPARREQVYVINLVKRWIRSVLGFYKIPRRRDEDPTSPNALEENAPRERLCRTGSDPSRTPVWLHYQNEEPSALSGWFVLLRWYSGLKFRAES